MRGGGCFRSHRGDHQEAKSSGSQQVGLTRSNAFLAAEHLIIEVYLRCRENQNDMAESKQNASVPAVAWLPLIIFVTSAVAFYLIEHRQDARIAREVQRLVREAEALQERDPAQALRVYRRALEISPEHRLVRDRIAAIQKRMDEDFMALKKRARAHMDLRYWNGAKQILDELVAKGFRDAEVDAMLQACAFHLRAGRLLWALPVESPVTYAAAVVGEHVVACTNDSTLVAFHITDIRESWRHDVTVPVNSDLLFAHDRIYFTTYPGDVVAFNLAGRYQEWRVRRAQGIKPRASLAATDDRLLVLLRERALLCLDAKTGDEVWSFEYPGHATHGVATDGRGAYFMNDRKQAFAVQLKDGTKRWDASLGLHATALPALADGRLLLVCEDWLSALSTDTGEVVWSRKLPAPAYSAPVVSGATVFVATSGGQHPAVRLADGGPLWTLQIPGPILSSPAQADGKIFVAAEDLFCLNAAAGEVIWRAELESDTRSPILVGRGRVFVGGFRDAKIMCYDSGYDGLDGWSQVGGNAARTCANGR